MADFPWGDLTETADNWEQRTIVVYGKSGTGKTNLAAQFPKPLFLACDPGTLGGLETARKYKGVKFLKIDSWTKAQTILPILEQQAGKEFKTLIVDSITYLGRLCMDVILQSKGKEIPTFDEYKLNYARMCHFINKLSDLKCHIVFNALDQTTKDEKTGKVTGGPSLPGKLTDELPQAVSICARLFAETSYDAQGKLTVTYKYRVVPDSTYYAKDRLELIPKEGIITGEKALEVFIKPLFKSEEF